MLARNQPRKLLVEGETDRGVIAGLVEANGVPWPDPPNSPVFIDTRGSVNEILKPGVLEAELGATGLEALGVVVDANGDAASRWDDLRAWCGSQFPDLPDQIPADGLEVVHSGGPRFGVWIMPDNRFTGMLEDWLVGLIPEESRPLYELAQNCVSDSKRQNAPFKDIHRTKAEIHTWLAWQDETRPATLRCRNTPSAGPHATRLRAVRELVQESLSRVDPAAFEGAAAAHRCCHGRRKDRMVVTTHRGWFAASASGMFISSSAPTSRVTRCVCFVPRHWLQDSSLGRPCTIPGPLGSPAPA